MLGSLLSSRLGRARNRATEVNAPQWSIALLRAATIKQLASAEARVILKASDVTDCEASFVADPFLIQRGDTWYLFFEIFSVRRERGLIGVATSTDTVHWTYQGIALEENFHLSYPFVFEYEGEMYLMPETKKAREVRVYRAVDFPRRWVFDRRVLKGRYTDASIVFDGTLWWLFACQGSYSLALFYSHSPLGKWKRHHQGLIYLRNKERGRPGGRPIIDNGKIVRFVQDARKQYGHQVLAFKVSQLTTWRFKEREFTQEPFLTSSGKGWNAVGMHHIDPHRLPDGSWLAVVDGMGSIEA